MPPPEALLVLSTCPPPEAERLARHLVEGGHAACVNVVPEVRSFYQWEGKLVDDRESLLLIKTAPDRLESLTAALLAVHPYQVPEVISLDVTAGNPRYLAWVREMTRPRAAPRLHRGPGAEGPGGGGR